LNDQEFVSILPDAIVKFHTFRRYRQLEGNGEASHTGQDVGSPNETVRGKELPQKFASAIEITFVDKARLPQPPTERTFILVNETKRRAMGLDHRRDSSGVPL
jgi:hypothetical protein